MQRVFLTTLFVFGLMFSLQAHAETIRIEGTVVDPNGQPIPNVNVQLPILQAGAITDDAGEFSISVSEPGTYRLEVSHIAFQAHTLTDIAAQNGTIDLGPIILKPKVLEQTEFVTTATRTRKDLTEISRAVNVINELSIKRREAKTSAETLREEAGVFVQKTNHGGGSAIIRGLSSNQILILVDGIRLNNSTYRLGNHQYLTTVDNHMVSQIEVVRGPGSVLYGSDALGGTINLITRQPSLLTASSQFEYNYRVAGRYASADEEKTGRLDVSVYNSKLAIQAGFSNKEFGDLRRGDNSDHPELENSTNGLKQSPSGFTARDFDGKLIYAPDETQHIVVAHQRSEQEDVPRYDKYENDDYYQWLYTPQNRVLTYLGYENRLQTRFIDNIKATLSYHYQEEGRETQQTESDILNDEKFDVGTTGLTLQLDSIWRGHQLSYGADVYYDRVSSERYSVDPVSGERNREAVARYPDGANYLSLGVFVQDEIYLNERWIVTPGLRWSYFETEFDISADPASSFNLGMVQQDFQALTGSIGAVFTVTPSLYLTGNVAQAFRAPNLSDLSKIGESKGDTYEVPNPDLEPEKMVSFDLGVNLNTRRLAVRASSYYASINDLLATANGTYNGSSTIEVNGQTFQVKAKDNVGEAYLYGVEGALDFRLAPHLAAYGNVSYTYGQNTTKDEPIGGVPPVFGLAGLRWEHKAKTVEFFTRFAGEQDRLSSDDLDDPRIPNSGTPGWQTLNIRGSLTVWDYATLRLGVENILDTNYREHGSGVNGPGRNFIVSLEVAQ